MRIAVVGSGIAGLASAWLLSRKHAVTLYEANDYLGGHTHTHAIELEGREYAVDTGFIVFNPQHYPLLARLFAELGVASKPTTMSFSVHNEASGLEYNATSLDSLFCQRRDACSPRFLGMVRDLLRFYRDAPALLDDDGDESTLEEWLARRRYGKAFRDDHLVPMASALWSAPPRDILQFPMRYLVQFMANHHMLQVSGRPEWRVVEGGSQRYVDAMRRHWRVTERLKCPVLSVQRQLDGVSIRTPAGTERYDHVVMACHSDQALLALEEPSDAERAILGAIPYQANDVVLHTDERLLPRARKAWAAWNAFVPASADDACTVSYCMNLLQDIKAPKPLVVTLNRSHAIDQNKVLRRMRYHHPVYTRASVAARHRKHDIQGKQRTWYAGAYWGWGFHEDGMRSAVDVARALGVAWPEQARVTIHAVEESVA